MCKVMGVYRNSYYNYINYQQRRDNKEHETMLGTIKEIAKTSRYSYGNRRIKNTLNILGYPVGRKKTIQLMSEAGIQMRYRKKYKVTTDSQHRKPVFDNVLNRQFTVSAPNQAYASDITYIHTQEGWLYLAVIIDLYSRKTVGWSM